MTTHARTTLALIANYTRVCFSTSSPTPTKTAGRKRAGLHRGLHEPHDAHRDEHLHREPGRGGLFRDPVLPAADRRLGRDRNVVHGQGHVQGRHLLSGELLVQNLMTEIRISVVYQASPLKLAFVSKYRVAPLRKWGFFSISDIVLLIKDNKGTQHLRHCLKREEFSCSGCLEIDSWE